MSKILQIRRGSSDAHNNFTGMPGEVSFDTDAKTLRVHDGETLGGFALARADQIPTPGDGVAPDGTFDITSVSDEFWAETIAKFTPAPFAISDSPYMKIITSVPYTECIFGQVNMIPAIVKVALVCQSPDAGYAIGDTVSAFGIGDRTNPDPNTWVDNDGLHVRLMTAGEQFWVSNKNTGIRTNITPDNWQLLFRVYC